MNGYERLRLKRVVKNYVNPLLPSDNSVTFLYPFKISELNWFSVFWWYKKATLGRNGLKNTLVKGYVKKDYVKKRLMKKTYYKRHNHSFWLLLIFDSSLRVIQMSCFSFFFNLFCLPGGIIDEKRMGAIFKEKDKK